MSMARDCSGLQRTHYPQFTGITASSRAPELAAGELAGARARCNVSADGVTSAIDVGADGAEQLAAGAFTVCAIDQRGAVTCWGARYPSLRVGSEPFDDGDLLAVSPGTVTVLAVAGRQLLFEESVAVQRGETRDVAVRLDAAAPVTATVAVPEPVPPRQQVRVVVTPPRPPSPLASRGPGIGPWLVLGGGAVALGLSAMFIGLRESAKSSRDAACGVGYCTQAAADFQATAETDNVAMYVALGVGAAAATAGVVWLATGGSSAEAPARTTLSVGAAPTRGGMVFGVGGSL